MRPLKISVPLEIYPGEKRVSASPETVKKMVARGAEVFVQEGAGAASLMFDDAYRDAGATIVSSTKELYAATDLVLKVRAPSTQGLDEASLFPQGAVLVAMGGAAPLSPSLRKIRFFDLERMPRITRAQNMDVLSSQNNLLGYRAVIEGAFLFSKAFPLMMTAAGTIAPAKVLVLGAGVAGLQAIATARRLGAVVTAFDVRLAAKEQVESLGARFITVDSTESGEGTGGYAKEMSPQYQKDQAAKISAALEKADIVICTALIPGKPAPCLISTADLKGMQPGSVIVDLAVDSGGNCQATEKGSTVIKEHVHILGDPTILSRVAGDASALYARNLFNFIELLWDHESQSLRTTFDDQILTATLVPFLQEPAKKDLAVSLA